MEERILHHRPPLWLPPLVALLLGGAYLAGKLVESRPDPATITVSGEGRVTAVPDIAELRFGVQTGRQPTAQAVMESLQKAMTAVIDSVRAQGVEEKDIRTESLWLNPAYDWTEQGRIDRGYEANQNLLVKIRDLTKIGSVLTAATAAGANQIGGVQLTIDDPETLRTQAREEAIVEAQQKAQLLASQLGVVLGTLRGFSEGGGFPPIVPLYERAIPMAAGGDELPVPTGEQEIHVTVNLTYEVR
jgi:uncharacterized protein YggE